jgi:hypothetical protein
LLMQVEERLLDMYIGFADRNADQCECDGCDGSNGDRDRCRQREY